MQGLFCVLASCRGSASPDSAPAAAEAALNGVGNDGSRDCLFVSDDPPGDTAQVDYYDALTGAYLGVFGETGAGDLNAARGLVFGKRGGPNADLLVVDQNALANENGEILRYSSDGEFLGKLVAPDRPGAPFAPRGMILGKHHILYVADMGDEIVVGGESVPGRLATYDARTGEFLGDLEPCAGFENRFFPRGVVIGPDGDLYVSTLYGEIATGGAVLRFDTKTGQCVEALVTSEDCMCGFSRPEGLVFGPDGNLYITSAARGGVGTNAIFVFNGQTGDLEGRIDLGASVATALLFGPGGYLYVTITGPDPSVRRYDVAVADNDVALEPFVIVGDLGTMLERPFYLTFCNTNPATLAYEPRGSTCCAR